MIIKIIIPVHNRLNKTILCIESLILSLYKISKIDYEINIIDDGSTDGTQKKISSKFPNIKFVYGDGSLFWTGAINAGLNKICKFKDDYIMILNNDVEIEENFFITLKDKLDHLNNKFLLGATAIDRVTGKTVRSGGKVLSWLLNINKIYFNGADKKFIKDINDFKVHFLTGRCMIFKASIISDIGLFNSKKLPHYAADEEFCIRAYKKDYNIILSTNLIVYVDTSTTGIKVNFWKDGIRSIKFRLFDIRSSSNLITKTNFSLLVAPWYAMPSHLLASYCKSLLSFFMFKK